MGKTIGIIQARMASSRLPGKILAPLADRPLLAHLHARIDRSHVDEWWLATSSDPSDDVTEAWGFELGLRVFRGSVDDVLSRFLAIGAETRAQWIVRVIANNPFVDAPLIDSLLEARDATLETKHADVIRHRCDLPNDDENMDPGRTETPASALPLGYAATLIRRDALDRAAREIRPGESHHRVRVASWPTAKGRTFDVPAPAGWPARPDWRWTLDTYQDLAMARSAFRLFGKNADTIDYAAMVACLDAHPEITGMNAHIQKRPREEV